MSDAAETKTDPAMPNPTCWPECSECETEWILRRVFDWRNGVRKWLWMPDCKCGKRKRPEPAEARLMTADGPVPT